VSYLTKDHLSEKYPLIVSSDNILLNGSVLPTDHLIQEINSLLPGEVLKKNGIVIAVRVGEEKISDFKTGNTDIFKVKVSEAVFSKIDFPWHIFSFNDHALRDDFKLLTKGRTSAPISPTNRVVSPENVFLEEGAVAEFSILNGSTGPIYIGKDAEIMEGCVVRGPLAMCEHSALKLGAKIYGATTLGPHTKVGGEVNNSVIFGYSSKAHDGFLGNSVLGEWCNLGADTNNSNLKNNYAEVRIWNYPHERFIGTGLQFCGLIMGDHSKSAINTMFNTGTVVGVSANIFGAGFPKNFVPSFTWGGPQGMTIYSLPKVFEVAKLVMKRRDIEFDEIEQKILTRIFEMTSKYRKFLG
jgi:UDP-N-acetylglucosamine diphosphorylase/glucosamine-1-phosphate N-acetyltransferase